MYSIPLQDKVDAVHVDLGQQYKFVQDKKAQKIRRVR